MNSPEKYTELAGRILLALIFLLAGAGKISGYEATAAYMNAMAVPGILLPLVILLEIGGAIAIILGFQTRLVAWGLAAFCLLSAVVFHNQLGDEIQFVMFFKNLAMAGGFLILAANGPGALSLDRARQVT